MTVTTDALFRIAYGRFAIGAYNINNLEQALGLFRGHMQADALFIVEVSKGARAYAGTPMIEAIIRTAPPSSSTHRRSTPCILTTATSRPATLASSQASTRR